MSILLDRKSRVLVQGITGRVGSIQTKWMLEYGTNIVAGVTPGRGGQVVEGVPVFNTAAEAVRERGAEVAVFFVPPPLVKDAAIENINAGIKLIAVVTEHMPVHDAMELRAYASTHGARLFGPTSTGIITPGEAKIGIMPGSAFRPGRFGVISRSGTLCNEVSVDMAAAGLGQSTAVGLGADPVVFTTLPDILKLFEEDPGTDQVVIIGEVGGTQEEHAANFIKKHMKKPVVAYIAGHTAPPGKRMGHAGAIVQGNMGTYESKVNALRAAGALIAEFPAQVPGLIKSRM